MRKIILRATLALSLALFGLASGADAQSSTQSVSIQVDTVNVISVSGNPGALVVNSATAGSQPDDATDASTSWAVTTNLTSQKLTASVGTTMPSGVTLSLNATAPTGGTGAGDVALSTTDQDVVTSISTLNESGLGLSYTLSATPSAGVVAQQSKTVTLTITAGV